MSTRAHESGLWGEKLAARFLKRKGYKILGRRVRLSPRDELDLVARQAEVLVFVEVKTRRGDAFGRPVEAVDHAKRRAQSRAAVRYLEKLGFPKVYFRFDVVEVLGEPGRRDAAVMHIENAFSLDARYRLPY